jgi:cystathionine beta-synthase
VDPYGSILALPDSLNGIVESYKVEGIGYDFIPDVLDRKLVDQWYKTGDKESFINARRLIKEEGLLVGGSSGSSLTAALHVCKQYKKGQRVVVMLPDSVRNYMSKFLNDAWMEENSFAEMDKSQIPSTWWSSLPVSAMNLNTPVTVSPTMKASTCIDILNKNGYDQLPCVDNNGSILGVIALGNITSQITSGRVKPTDPVSKALYRQFRQVTMKTTLGELSRIFDRDHFALVVTTQRQYQDTDSEQATEKSVIFGIVTRIDLLDFIVTSEPKKNAANDKH